MIFLESRRYESTDVTKKLLCAHAAHSVKDEEQLQTVMTCCGCSFVSRVITQGSH